MLDIIDQLAVIQNYWITASYLNVDQWKLLKLDKGLHLFGLMHTHLYDCIQQPGINND